MHVFVTWQLPGTVLDRLHARHSVTVWPGRMPPDLEDLLGLAMRADGLLMVLTDRVDGGILDTGPAVQATSNYVAGFENIYLPATTVRGIPVRRASGVLTEAIAPLATRLTLALLRRVSEADIDLHYGRSEAWESVGYLGASFGQATLGLAGYARIGQAAEHMARALGMRVIYPDPGSVGHSLREVLAQSDVVSLHAPLTPKTTGRINARTLVVMRPGALLVNTARGAMIDTAALARALRSGHLASAGLDVTEPEPLPAGHELFTFLNVMVTPHGASAAIRIRYTMADPAVENLLTALGDRLMPHCANPGVYVRSASAH